MASHCKPEKETLFLELIEAYGKAFPTKSKQAVQKEVSQIWRDLKNLKSGLQETVAEKLKEWRDIEIKRKGTLLSFWGNLPKSKEQNTPGKSNCLSDTQTQPGTIVEAEIKEIVLPDQTKQKEETSPTSKQDQL